MFRFAFFDGVLNLLFSRLFCPGTASVSSTIFRPDARFHQIQTPSIHRQQEYFGRRFFRCCREHAPKSKSELLLRMSKLSVRKATLATPGHDGHFNHPRHTPKHTRFGEVLEGRSPAPETQ